MTTPSTMKADFESQFGKLNAKQLWLITKLSKYVRLRARNNAAFNNLFNQVFPHARFSQVTKTRIPRFVGDAPSYPGLQITVKEIQVPAVTTNLVTIPAETVEDETE